MRSVPRPEALSDEQPWPGLMPFGEDAQAYFHGREAETAELLRLIKRDVLTVLFGASGLGKSSLLAAGLFPRLRADEFFPVYVRLDVAASAPSPAEQVKALIRTECERHRVDAPAPAAGETLWEFFHRKETHFWSPRNRLLTPVIVLDQFEEIFTLGRHVEVLDSRCRAFIVELADLVEDRAPAGIAARLEGESSYLDTLDFGKRLYKVVLSFREDYLAEFEELRKIIPSIMHNRMRLASMNGVQAREAVIKAGRRLVSDEVADRIVRFVAAPRGSRAADDELSRLEVEPALLSVVCRELNGKRIRARKREITSDLLEAGAQQEIIKGFYDSSLAGVDESVRDFIEDQLLTEAGHRDSYALEDALRLPGITRSAIDLLIRRRLLRLEERSGVLRVELTHDVLTPVAKESRDLRQQREAEQRALERERARRRRVRNLSLAGAVASLAAIALAVVFGVLLERSNREKQRLIETQSYVFLGQAIAGLDQNVPGEPAANLAQAIRLHPGNQGATARAVSLLSQRDYAAAVGRVDVPDAAAVRWLDERWIVIVAGDSVRRVRGDDLGKSEELALRSSGDDFEDFGLLEIYWRPITDKKPAAAEPLPRIHSFDPVSKTIVVISRKRVLHFFDADTLREVGRGVQVTLAPARVSISPGRKWAAVGAPKRRIELFRLDGRERTTFEAAAAPHDARAPSVEALADDGALALATGERELLLYRAPGPGNAAPPRRLDPFDGPVAISPNGRSLAVARREEVALYDLGTGLDRGRFAHPMPVTSVAFSGDGSLLATGCLDKFARVWDVRTQAAVGVPVRHEGAVRSARFSRDGRTLVTGAMDGTARVTSVRTGEPVLEPMIHSAPVVDAEPSPDGRYVLAATGDERLSAWRIPDGASSPAPPSLSSDVSAMAISPDGAAIALGSRSGELAMWALPAEIGRSTGAQAARRWGVTAPNDAITLVQFSPDGKRLAAATAAGLVHVLAADGGKPVVKPLRHLRAVRAMQFDADGRLLATGAADGAARIWDLERQRVRGLPMAHGASVTSVRFGPDGRTLLSTGADQSVRLWDVASTVAIGARAVGARIGFAGFGADPANVVIVAGDRLLVWPARQNRRPEGGALRTWRVPSAGEGQNETQIPLGRQGWVGATSPDGGRLVIGALDGSASIIDLATMRRIGEMMKHNGVVLAAEFSTDGRWIVTRGSDGGVRVWDSQSGYPVTDASRHDAGVVAAALARGGELLVVATSAPQLSVRTVGLDFHSPPPTWLAPLVEAAGGRRIEEAGTSYMAVDRLTALATTIGGAGAAANAGWWQAWAAWMIARLQTAR